MGIRTLGLAVALSMLNDATASGESRPVVLVRIYGADAVAPATLARSRRRVESILSGAGIAVEWRDCAQGLEPHGSCDTAPDVNVAVVRLLSGRSRLSAHGCGVAQVPSTGAAHYVTIFAGCIRDGSDRLRTAEDVLLGATLAHEIGHLVLGPQHGSTGLMQTQPRPLDWERAAHDGLGFTQTESRRMRERLGVRQP